MLRIAATSPERLGSLSLAAAFSAPLVVAGCGRVGIPNKIGV
jgi:hypothetical protein